jgi:hypothetical protein
MVIFRPRARDVTRTGVELVALQVPQDVLALASGLVTDRRWSPKGATATFVAETPAGLIPVAAVGS